MANYVQPDYRAPVNGASVQVESIVNALIASPVQSPAFIERVTPLDDPQGNIRVGKSGKKPITGATRAQGVN
jgi:hypothetical protein